jgi:predicted nucleic acid-binding protein
MRIVSNTTPISELHKIGHLDLLRIVYGRLYIPGAVADELARARRWPGLSDVIERNPWISVRSLADADAQRALQARHTALHEGEAAAMILARELAATRIILDDRRARRAAHGENLPVIGTVGVVLLGCRLRRISVSEGQKVLDLLYTGTAYIGEGLYREARRRLR